MHLGIGMVVGGAVFTVLNVTGGGIVDADIDASTLFFPASVFFAVSEVSGFYPQCEGGPCSGDSPVYLFSRKQEAGTCVSDTC